ncbi:hypothetical protein PFISCL1PPCAC_1703, partial [Pristionchus fissidentatus]
LYRHLNSIHFKLLSENKQGWDVIWQALLKHKVPNVYYAIRQRVDMELAKCTNLMTQRDNERRNFNTFLSSLPPKPAIRTSKENKKDSSSVNVSTSNVPLKETVPN